jgi:hypothetical protein
MSNSDGRYSQPNTQRTVRAYCEGRTASRAGALISSNPHDAAVDNESHLAWDRGHRSYVAGRTVTLNDECAQTGLVDTPVITVSMAAPEVDPDGLTVTFTPSLTYTLTYFFGDGASEESELGTATHTYPASGTYVAQVFGPTGVQTVTVTVTGVSSFDWFVDSVTGNDADAGNTSALAFKTLAAALAVVSNNESIGIAAGSVLRERAALASLTGVKVYRYGAGDNPIITDATAVTSGWTQSGDEWRRALAAEPPSVYARADGDYDTALALVKGTYGALAEGEWDFDTDTLSVRLAGDVDPNTVTIEITAVTAGDYALLDFASTADDWEINDLQLMFSGGNGIYSDAAGLVANRCRFAYNTFDGFGAFGSATVTLNDCISEYNGNGARDPEAGDGVSLHATSIGEINGGIFRYNDKCQINNLDTASVTTRRALIISGESTYGCWRVLGTDGGGDHRLESSVLVHEGTNALDNCIDVQTPTPVTIINNSLLSSNDTALNGMRFSFAAPTGPHVVHNNIIAKFGRAINYQGDVVQDVDYNCFWGNTTRYYTAGGTGLFAGAHDIVGDPLWTNAGALDFTLGNGSPCIAAGGTTDVVLDYAEVSFKSPPSIGALEK